MKYNFQNESNEDIFLKKYSNFWEVYNFELKKKYL